MRKLTLDARVRPVVTLFAVLSVAWLPALLGRGVVIGAAGLYELAEAPNPYLIPDQALRLYVALPAVVASACLLLLSPGLLLAMAVRSVRGASHFIVIALGLSLTVLAPVTAAAQWLLGGTLLGDRFALLVIACSFVACGIAVARRRHGAWGEPPWHRPLDRASLLSAAAAPVLFFVATLPKFLWECLNGDGAHAFESARLLLHQSLPFWPHSAGAIAAFPGVDSTLFTVPASWFLRLFGEREISARLPFLLYLPALHAAITMLAEEGSARSLRLGERWLVWMGLAIYALAMSFSATYSPYAADIALPATQDTLVLVFYLAFVWAFVRRERAWICFFMFLGYLSAPSWTLLWAFWLLAVFALWRPIPWQLMATAAAAFAACALAAALLDRMLVSVGAPVAGTEYGVPVLLHRFRFWQFSDWSRLAYVAVPCGIVPVLALAVWSEQDRVARALTLVTVWYFAFFYLQAYVSLHQFSPAMVLPLAVWWRSRPSGSERQRRASLGATITGGLVALWLVLPESAAPHVAPRRVGAEIEDRIGGYDTMAPDCFRGSAILRYAFPMEWDRKVPEALYGASPLVWNYYAHRGTARTQSVNYLIQRASDPPPDSGRRLAEKEGFALFVIDEDRWHADRALWPPHPAGSRLLAVPRTVLFRSDAAIKGPADLDLLDLLQRTGLDPRAIVGRLGLGR